MADTGTVVLDLIAKLGELGQSGSTGAEPSGRRTDLHVDLFFPPGDVVLQVELRRTSITDRADVDRLPKPGPDGHPVLVAPFLSPAVRDELRRSGWSYCDSTGNVLIQIREPFIWIDRVGAHRNPTPEQLAGPQRLRSLKGRAVSMVMVKLLEQGRAPSVRDLARESTAGVATVSRVVELLRKEELLSDTRGGPIVVTDRSRLAHRWAESYNFARTFKAKRYYSLLGDDVALQRLRTDTLPYAITGVRAANEWLGVRGRLGSLPSSELWLYAPDRDAVERTLDLMPDPRGPILVGQASENEARGYPSGSGLLYAAPWRTVGDLLSTAGRTAAVGEELMDDLIASWPTGLVI